MTSELDLHAYIFTGNALNDLLTSAVDQPDIYSQLGASEASLRELLATVEPLTPANLLATLRDLPPAQRTLLERCFRWSLANLGPEFEPMMGLTPAEASRLIEALSQLRRH